MRSKHYPLSLVALAAALALWLSPVVVAQEAEAPAAGAMDESMQEAPVPADAEMVNAETVRELLVATGTLEVLDQMWDGMMSQLQMAYPDLSQSVWDELAATYGMDSFVEEVIPIYQRYLTQADAEAAVAFWKSDAGRRFSSVQAAMATEGAEAGMSWGQRLDEFLTAKVEEMEASDEGMDGEMEGVEGEMDGEGEAMEEEGMNEAEEGGGR